MQCSGSGGGKVNRRVVLVAFHGEPTCFVHGLLNALDMKDRGYEVRVVIEGAATALVKDLNDASKPFAELYRKVREEDLIDCVCQACSAKMGVLDEARSQGLPICGEMNGHPSLARYLDEGYQVITL
jgi:hypothetical protein